MAAFSRGARMIQSRRSIVFRPLNDLDKSFYLQSVCISRSTNFTQSRCGRFSTTSTVYSGHNRWSKIKHDKGSADAKRSILNAFLSKQIAQASKDGGPDPNMNTRLALELSKAKKAGLSKANMEGAIARGQGRSTSGAALEYITLEAIMPSSIAVIIEAETENIKRTLEDLRYVLKKHGGRVSPTGYLFQKKGRLLFEKDERNFGVDEVLDEAIEAGAEDVETDDDGNIVVWTEPTKTSSAAVALQKSLDLKLESSDIIWDANEDTRIPLGSEEAQKMSEFIDAIRDQQGVQALYANVAQGSLSEDVWGDVQGKLDA